MGVISRPVLEEAIRTELAGLGEEVIAKNLERALHAYGLFETHAGCVTESVERGAEAAEAPDWVDLPFEEARVSAPNIHGAATSGGVRPGLWRTLRPIIDPDLCHRCHWVCTTFCPDGAIAVDADGAPRIDYDHCKGCLVCVAVCPPHAIQAIPEREADAAEARREAS